MGVANTCRRYNYLEGGILWRLSFKAEQRAAIVKLLKEAHPMHRLQRKAFLGLKNSQSIRRFIYLTSIVLMAVHTYMSTPLKTLFY